MPKRARELTALEVRRMKHPGHGRHAIFAVGGVEGLALQISETGARSWLLRFMSSGKRRHMGLGGYPNVSLAQARERAREARNLIWNGQDPIENRKAAKAAHAAKMLRNMTFAEAMERFLEVKLNEFDNEKHRKQWRATLDRYAIPVLGPKLVDEIDVQDVQAALAQIWMVKTETASRLRGRVESVLAWATVNGHRSGDNPARWKGNLDAILPKPSKVARVQHHPALSLKDAPKWFRAVHSRDGNAARALEFMALTAVRSGEVRGAVWNEIDFDQALWILPSNRMKAQREHRVPLTSDAVSLLSKLPRQIGSPYVFAAPRGGPLSDMALSACMRRIHAADSEGYLDARSGRPAVPHGLRSTFRDWAAEKTEYSRDIAEIALAHRVGTDVERAYRRGDMLDRRRQLMKDWASFLCREPTADILELGARR